MLLFFGRNSPHNFKKQNAAKTEVSAIKKQVNDNPVVLTKAKFEMTSPVQFVIPSFNFSGIMKIKTNVKVKKPKMTLDKVESLFNLPTF